VPADYTEVAKGLKKLLADSNMSVVSCAVKAIGALAPPLGRDGFGAHAKKLAPALVEKSGVKNLPLSQVASAARPRPT
jgi:hypothetical protein